MTISIGFWRFIWLERFYCLMTLSNKSSDLYIFLNNVISCVQNDVHDLRRNMQADVTILLLILNFVFLCLPSTKWKLNKGFFSRASNLLSNILMFKVQSFLFAWVFLIFSTPIFGLYEVVPSCLTTEKMSDFACFKVYLCQDFIFWLLFYGVRKLILKVPFWGSKTRGDRMKTEMNLLAMAALTQFSTLYESLHVLGAKNT